jgi:cytoskeletal protein RodZ
MPSFGENLRRERELRGISLREIADDTRIGIRFLQALEQDRIDLLPGGIFRRTFVRQYANHLGLDAEKVVAEFIYSHGADETIPVPPRAPRRHIPIGTLVTLAAFLALAVLSFVRSHETDAASAAAVAVAPAPTPPPERVYPGGETAPGEREAQNLVLTLSARESCWVAVQVDGEPVLNRVLNEGETETLEAEGRIVLSVGNAGGLSFSVNDRPGVRLGRAGEVKRNIVITRQSLPELVDHSS